MTDRAPSLAKSPAAPLAVSGLRLQRKCTCGTHTSGAGNCAECKKKEVRVQTKLRVGQARDTYEQEADRIADRVTAASAYRSIGSAPPRIQRVSSDLDGLMSTVPPSVDQVLASPGRPLDAAVRTDMEQRFGHDFSRVRVHGDSLASESAQAMQARAYTAGNHVVFNAGEYEPGSRPGRHLLAHELTHVVQQGGASAHEVTLRRQPLVHEATDECHIRNARAYIYFEIARRFNDPTDSDPRVLTRARCLKKAFGLLDARDAIEFAQQIMKREGIYADYMRLHHATRLQIAEVLAARLNRRDTSTYEARLLSGDVFVSPDSPESPAPKLTINAMSGGITVTLDKPVLALGDATLIGSEECDKYTFGFTQFVTEQQQVQEFYFPDLGNYYIINAGLAVAPFLPCYDVFNTGDVWSYSAKLDCGSASAVKGFGDKGLFFSDTPSTPFVDTGDAKMLPSSFKWRNKFVAVFYATLPNGAVHFFSWFDWNISYCRSFPHTVDARRTITALPGDAASRKVDIGSVRQGAPSSGLASMAGKPAPDNCNNISRTTPSISYPMPISTVACP